MTAARWDGESWNPMGEGLGHGVGLELHEYPFMGKGCQLKIQQGCVITIEPGIYYSGKYGIRIEEDIFVSKKGTEVLSKNLTKELLMFNRP